MNRKRLELRAQLLSRARQFFAKAGVLEVETPILSTAATPDPHIESLTTSVSSSPNTNLYLHTSPEFAMKRLLSAGSGDIFQICKVFRDGEVGNKHRPEFTLLEWYRLGYDDEALAREVDQLLRVLLRGYREIGEMTRVSYDDALKTHANVDGSADAHALRSVINEPMPTHATQPELLDFVFATQVAPELGQGSPCVVHDFPANQAALARLRDHGRTAARFEVFLEGVELANGFHELTDAAEQRRRFEAELAMRRETNAPQVPLDEAFLEALEQGLPDCSGVALGLDRVLMLAAGTDNISDVLAIP